MLQKIHRFLFLVVFFSCLLAYLVVFVMAVVAIILAIHDNWLIKEWTTVPESWYNFRLGEIQHLLGDALKQYRTTGNPTLLYQLREFLAMESSNFEKLSVSPTKAMEEFRYALQLYDKIPKAIPTNYWDTTALSDPKIYYYYINIVGLKIEGFLLSEQLPIYPQMTPIWGNMAIGN